MQGLPPPNHTRTNEQGAAPLHSQSLPQVQEQPPLRGAVLGQGGQPVPGGVLPWPPSRLLQPALPSPARGEHAGGRKDADTEMRPPSLAEERPEWVNSRWRVILRAVLQQGGEDGGFLAGQSWSGLNCPRSRACAQ